MNDQPFPSLLRAAMNGRGARTAARLVGCNPRTFWRWLAGTSTPHEAVQAAAIKALSEVHSTTK